MLSSFSTNFANLISLWEEKRSFLSLDNTIQVKVHSVQILYQCDFESTVIISNSSERTHLYRTRRYPPCLRDTHLVVLEQPGVVVTQEVILRTKFDLPSGPFVSDNARTHPLDIPQSAV